MIRYRRPPRPVGFAAASPRSRRRGPFEPIWGSYKSHFSASQYGKCGYCESYVAGTQDADVEHYAPKAGVHDLDATSVGSEAEPGLARLKHGSRQTTVRSTVGYWWRAYDWTNYLFACAVCNQKYKGNVFPLSPTPPTGWKPIKSDTVHRPLVINCYDDAVPWRHFRFDSSSGAVVGATPRGTATIGTCGLHRDTLLLPRRQAIQDVVRHHSQLMDLSETALARDRAWRAIAERGADDRPFAGAVRAVAEHLLSLPWDDIVAYAATLPRR